MAQNAADAAARSGRPGRLWLRLRGGVLSAANTGAPLDPGGVLALSTLRASAKRSADSVGRFGVGFAAVRTVCDEPAIGSGTGAVRWSRAEAARLAAAVPELAGEVARRDGAVPALRLPFPAELAPPPGFDTVVALPLRDDAAVAVVRRELAEIDPALLLALPGLAELVVEVHGVRRLSASWSAGTAVLHDDAERTVWRVVRRSGRHPVEALADRPVEERARPEWSVLVAVPVDGSGGPAPLPGAVPALVRAPTVTAEPLSLPVVLVGSWPLDSTRRQVATGPAQDALVAAAAAAYAELVGTVGTGPAMLDLVPTGLAAGALDARLRAAVLDRLGGTAFLPLAGGGRARPGDTIALDLGPAAVAALAGVVSGLLPPEFAGRLAPLAVLGVRRWTGVELAEALAGLSRPAAWWRALYAALAAGHLGGPERDALGALPVPLSDGRLVSGPRGALLPTAEVGPAALQALGLRAVHPEAAHPLLTLLGAEPAEPHRLLADPRVIGLVRASFDEEDPAPVAEAVLGLVRAAGGVPAGWPGQGELALPASDGEWAPAGELLLPDGRLAGVVDPDAPVGLVAPGLVRQWGGEVLRAVGVLDGFAVLREPDVPLDPDAADHDLAGEPAWIRDVLAGLPPQPVPPALVELVALRDLELVRPDAWPQALRMLPRGLLGEPAYAVLDDGRRVPVTPYLRWWLARAPVLGGARPVDLALAGSDLVGLYDPAPGEDPELLRLLGVRRSAADLLAAPGGAEDLLDRLADPARPVSRDQLRALYAALAGRSGPLPDRVRAVRGAEVVVVDAADAVVLDAPDLRPLLGDSAVLPVPLSRAAALAGTLDLPLASQLAGFPVLSRGTRRGELVVHDPLVVADVDGRPTEVPWRVAGGAARGRRGGPGRGRPGARLARRPLGGPVVRGGVTAYAGVDRTAAGRARLRRALGPALPAPDQHEAEQAEPDAGQADRPPLRPGTGDQQHQQGQRPEPGADRDHPGGRGLQRPQLPALLRHGGTLVD